MRVAAELPFPEDTSDKSSIF